MGGLQVLSDADSGLGGSICVSCLEGPPADEVPSLFSFLNVYSDLLKGCKIVCLCRKDRQRVILNVWRRLAVGSEVYLEDLAALASFCRGQ